MRNLKTVLKRVFPYTIKGCKALQNYHFRKTVFFFDQSYQ